MSPHLEMQYDGWRQVADQLQTSCFLHQWTRVIYKIIAVSLYNFKSIGCQRPMTRQLQYLMCNQWLDAVLG